MSINDLIQTFSVLPQTGYSWNGIGKIDLSVLSSLSGREKQLREYLVCDHNTGKTRTMMYLVALLIQREAYRGKLMPILIQRFHHLYHHSDIRILLHLNEIGKWVYGVTKSDEEHDVIDTLDIFNNKFPSGHEIFVADKDEVYKLKAQSMTNGIDMRFPDVCITPCNYPFVQTLAQDKDRFQYLKQLNMESDTLIYWHYKQPTKPGVDPNVSNANMAMKLYEEIADWLGINHQQVRNSDQQGNVQP